MPTSAGQSKRQVVPRWRPWKVTAALGQLNSDTERHDRSEASDIAVVDQRHAEWTATPDHPHAADFIGTAFAMGHGEQAREAAEAVLAKRDSAPACLVKISEAVLNGNQPVASVPPFLSVSDRRERIRKLRTRLVASPSDVLTHLDLAREYVIIGQREAARRPIRVALSLAPHSRLVTRSAARFYLNLDEPDRALAVIRRSPRVSSDPWLLAAEIAVADAAGESTRFMRIAKQMLARGDFSAMNLSEMAGALATVLMESGDRRGARKLFRFALQDPTENAVAQAEWVSSEFEELEFHSEQTPVRSFEANAISSMGEGCWDRAITNVKLWLLDEPFSTRPAYLGSWVSSVVAADFDSAVEFADLGLATKPRDYMLLNNRAVGLALLDRPDEARLTLNRIDGNEAKSKSEATYWATRGLVEYRSGNIELGRMEYQIAIETARKNRNVREECWALLFQSREELCTDPIRAEQLRRDGESKIVQLRRRDALVAERLLFQVRPPDATQAGSDRLK